MEILETLIYNLTSDEVRRFKILSNRFKAEEEKKLLILFDAIRSDQGSENDEIVKLLYGNAKPATKNRYYRLRNKLLDSIEKSLVFYHFKVKNFLHAIYDLQLAILARERGSYELAFYFLKKGEKKAVSENQFNLLDIFYDEYIQLGLKNLDVDVERIISQRKLNQELIDSRRKHTEAIALIRQRLKKARFSGNKNTVKSLLQSLEEEIEESDFTFQTTEGKVLIFTAVSTILHNRGDYDQLATYLYDTLDHFVQNDLFSTENHPIRLLMRLRLIIALFNENRISETLEQLSIFEEEMLMHGKQFYTVYLFNYLNIKISCLKLIGEIQEAQVLIDEALSIPEIKKNASHQIIILISKAGQEFNMEHFQGAFEVLERIKSLRQFKEMDPEIRFFIALFRLVCMLEIASYQEGVSASKLVRKQFKRFLKDEEYADSARFLDLLVRMFNAKLKGKNVSLATTYRKFEANFGTKTPSVNQIISPLFYLRSKLGEKGYYQLFLEESSINFK